MRVPFPQKPQKAESAQLSWLDSCVCHSQAVVKHSLSCTDAATSDTALKAVFWHSLLAVSDAVKAMSTQPLCQTQVRHNLRGCVLVQGPRLHLA